MYRLLCDACKRLCAYEMQQPMLGLQLLLLLLLQRPTQPSSSLRRMQQALTKMHRFRIEGLTGN